MKKEVQVQFNTSEINEQYTQLKAQYELFGKKIKKLELASEKTVTKWTGTAGNAYREAMAVQVIRLKRIEKILLEVIEELKNTNASYGDLEKGSLEWLKKI